MNKISAIFSVWTDNVIDRPMNAFVPTGVVRKGKDRDTARKVPVQNGYHFTREFEATDVEGAIGHLKLSNLSDIAVVARAEGEDVRLSLSFILDFREDLSLFLSASSVTWLASIGCDFDVAILPNAAAVQT